MRDLRESCRIAVVQAAPVMFDKAACTVKAVELIRAAAAERAELIVFPELFIPGYPYGMTFGGSGALFQQLGPGQNRLHRQGAVGGHGIQLGELPAQQSGAEFHGHDLPDNTKIAPEYDAEVFLFFIIHIVGKIMMICQ